MAVLDDLKPMLDIVGEHSGRVGTFLDGVQSASSSPGDVNGLAKIKAGASAMLAESNKSDWSWRFRFRLGDLASMRSALQGFIKNPASALTPVSGSPVGFVTGQLWADMAVEVVIGEWKAAGERRKMAPADLILFALGPAGVLVAFGLHGADIIEGAGDFIDDVAEGLGDAVDDALKVPLWLKVGGAAVGVALVGALAIRIARGRAV